METNPRSAVFVTLVSMLLACSSGEKKVAPTDSGSSEADVADETLDDTGPSDTACPSPCGVSPQCGCASDKKCAYDPVTLGCFPLGTEGLNDKCSGGGAACLAGHQCVNYGCLKFCSAAEPCSSMKGSPTCQALSGSPGPYCLQQCDPRVPTDVCGPGRTCGAVAVTTPGTASAGFSWTCAAALGSATGPGACAASADKLKCAPGYWCVSGNCRKWCDASDPCGCNLSFGYKWMGTSIGFCP